jgi:hypothetical protein
MTVVKTPAETSKALLWVMISYLATSLLHFAHNAEYLADYPNLPAWLSRSQVYVAWLCITALGILGYILYRRARHLTGLAVLALYAVLGFDGLLHYSRAPFTAHTMAMNLTIWSEVVAAGLLLIIVIGLAAKHLSHLKLARR